MLDKYEWDEAKNSSNLRKHGIAFDEAVQIFNGPVMSQTQFNAESGEYRDLSFGLLDGLAVAAVVHVERNGKTRIISARKATKPERKLFHDTLSKTLG